MATSSKVKAIPQTHAGRVIEDLMATVDMAVIARAMGELKPAVRPPCGTTCCIAGWAIVLGTRKKLTQFDNFLMDRHGRTYGAYDADELLDLGDDGQENLFFVRSWPANSRPNMERRKRRCREPRRLLLA